jgi:hypothetical protein
MSKQLITPELANEWITSYFYEEPLMHSVMRNIRPRHVDYLANEMKAGRFGSATIAFADCKADGRRFIVNGNHTLRAIVKSGVPLSLTVEHNECETLDRVRHLYATYDKNLVRQRADSLRAYDARSTLNIRQTDVEKLSSAVAYMMDGFGARVYPTKIPDTDLLAEMATWVVPYGKLLVAVGSTKPWFKRIFGRRPVLAVAIVSMRNNPDIAFPFWESVVTGAGLRRYAPALRLRDYLADNTIGAGGGTHIQDMAKAVAYCWNKHLRGELIVQMKVPYDKPLVIETVKPVARPVGRPVTEAPRRVAVPA